MDKKPKIDKGKGVGMTKEDCLELGQKALASFTGNELNDYVSEVFNRAKSYKDISGQTAIKRAMQEVNNETMEDLFHECTVKANNVSKFENKSTLIKNKKSDMRKMLDYRGKAQGTTLVGSQNASRATLADAVFDQNWNKARETFLFDKNNDMGTYDALDGRDAASENKQIAELINRFRDLRNAESVRSNAIPIHHLGTYRYLDHMHDSTAMINGGNNLIQRAKNLAKGIKADINAKDAWVNYIIERLDLPKMFQGSKGVDIDGNLNMEYVRRTLSNTFENITTAKSELFTKSVVANDREAIKRKQRMFLYFKDWRAWGEYNERYGQGSLAKALLADIMQSGGKIGLSDFFGDAPTSMWLDLKKVQEEVGVKLPVWDNFQSWDRKNEYTFNFLRGANPKSVRPELTNFLSSIRAFTSAVKAPYITISGLSDQAHMAEYLGRFGVNRFRSMGYLLANTFNNKLASVAFKDRKIIAKQFRLMLESHMGYMSRMMDAQNVGTMMNRFSSQIFKFFGTEAMDHGNKLSVLHLMADNLGRYSKKSWNSLNDHLKKQLDNFGITESEWNLLRTKTENRLFTLDNVNKLTDEELRQYHLGGDQKIPLTQLRNELYRKVYSMFDVASQNSVLNPSAFTKANMYANRVPGEIVTELWNSVMHFKSYPMTSMDRIWMQGFQNADGSLAKLMFATRLMAMTMPLSFMSTWLSYFAQGKTMPDIDSPKFWLEMALPGLGIFLSVMDKRNQNADLLFNMARSPSMGLIQNMLSGSLALIEGDTDAAKKRFKKALKTVSPMQNIPFLTPFLNEALGEDQSYLQPGQEQIYGV